jgi:hypothetical protein
MIKVGSRSAEKCMFVQTQKLPPAGAAHACMHMPVMAEVVDSPLATAPHHDVLLQGNTTKVDRCCTQSPLSRSYDLNMIRPQQACVAAAASDHLPQRRLVIGTAKKADAKSKCCALARYCVCARSRRTHCRMRCMIAPTHIITTRRIGLNARVDARTRMCRQANVLGQNVLTYFLHKKTESLRGAQEEHPSLPATDRTSACVKLHVRR